MKYPISKSSSIFEGRSKKTHSHNPPSILMGSTRNSANIITIRKGEIIAVHGDLTLAEQLIFKLADTGCSGTDVRPFQQVLLDFQPERFLFPILTRKQTVSGYVSQHLDGKLTGKTKARHWLFAFGLTPYASLTLADLPVQACYRLLFLLTVAHPVCILQMTGTENFDDFAAFLLDVKRFFRDYKLGGMCPVFVVLEERQSMEMAVVADGVVRLKGKFVLSQKPSYV